MLHSRWHRSISIQARFTLLLGLLVTAVLFAVISRLEYNKLSFNFERRADNRVRAIKADLENAVDTLSVVNRLFATVESVSREQFQAFTQPLLQRYPHIQNISFQRLISAAERPAFEAEMRKRYPDFMITELSNGKAVAAGIRDHYRVNDYLEPLRGNEAVFGLDAFSQKEQDQAVSRACETGKVSAAERFRIEQEKKSQHEFVMLMPVYRHGAALGDGESRCRAVIGYTAAVFREAALMENTLAARGWLNATGFDISIYTGDSADAKNLVFRTEHAQSGASSASRILNRLFYNRPNSSFHTFNVAGRPWLVVVSAASLARMRDHLGSLLTLAAGILISLLAAAYMQTLVSRARRIQRQVDERTAQLRLANDSLQVREQAIQACTNSIIITSATGPHYPIEYVNPAFEKITGYSAAEVIGQSCSILWRSDLDQNGIREIRSMVRAKLEVKAVLRTYRKDGTLFWSDVHIAPVKDSSGEIEHFVVAHYDITDTKRYEAELEYHANHDTLTGLANRNLVRDRLGQAIGYAARYEHALWVVFVDLDRFKFINDSLGHVAGDMFLKIIAERLQSVVHESDTVARLSGDEFLLILPERMDANLATGTVQHIMDVIAQPLTIEQHEFTPTCSVGIATYPADGTNPKTLIEHADLAMYRAKELGRNNFQFYTPTMNERARKRLEIESALRNALERAEFVVHYQPQVDLRTGQVVGMEALVRWQHPELGIVPPSRFIWLAEESGLIVPLGEWILRTACAQAKAWQRAGLGDLRIAVNLSARQFGQQDLVSLISNVLEETGLAAERLDLELTETLVMTDVEHAIGILNKLRALGVKLSIDDFGTGYSSLSYLKRFPIDVLKIDQSFVREISTNSNDAAISDAIISMAHSLGVRVIAEGVETEAQCEFLSRNMCDEMQGFLFSKALPANEIEALLREERCLPKHLLLMHKLPRTLLLVDDEPNILSALKRLMRRDNYQILTAAGGQEGLELLAQNEIDVIVSDQRMPGMTGVEFLRTVKTLYPETVRIVLSGFTELQSITDAVNEGAIYKFLTKPWDDTQLRQHVEEAFQHKEMADENRRLNLEVRAANQGLATANRQLEEVLKQKQQQIKRDEVTLDIVREALQHVPQPVIGLDDDEVLAFVNVAAQDLFKDKGAILGSEAAQLMPELLDAIHGVDEGEKCIAQLNGIWFEVTARSMGKGTQSRGKLITLTQREET